jgi:Na+/proline symporter
VVAASDPRVLQKGYAAGPGNRHLRASVLFAVGVEIAFLVFLTVFIWNHADPMGDGMEMVGVSMAVIFIFLPFTLPALLLAKESRYLVLAAMLAGIAAVLYFALWLEMLDELHIQQAPWS